MTLIIKCSVEPIVLSLLVILMLFDGSASAQNQLQIDNGITVTEKGDIAVFYDEFTGKYAISVRDITLLSSLYKDQAEKHKSFITPFFGGEIYNENLTELTWIERWSNDFIIVLIREEPKNHFFEEKGTKQIPFLIDEKRLSKSAYYRKKSPNEIIEIKFPLTLWEKVIKSENSRFRISGQVFTIDQNLKNLMEQILSAHHRIQSENTDIEKQKTVRVLPFELHWEGDINRTPVVQPLPNFVTETETVFSVRFEVRPDGTMGRLQPITKSDPELEREVLRTLRTWRFSRLPSNIPQVSQYGTITFRIVLE